jgi:tetraacyldisaccharide 4'-kinase
MPWLWPLIPLNWLFVLFSGLRRLFFRLGLKSSYRPPVPVVIVGNISVGGTGKTPLVVRLVAELQQAGFRPGIVSRGYGGKGPFPQLVDAQSTTDQVGDEPTMLAAITGVPVVVSPKRGEAVKHLLATQACDVVLSDDGLQHYALQRDIEIVVVDAARGLGNGWRLPCGPLREPRRRLKNVDWVVENGASSDQNSTVPMQLASVGWRSVRDGNSIETPDGESVIAIAGIGNPQRFFNLLAAEGLHVVETRIFADHHAYAATDFYNVSNQYPLVMTEKDAVKCRAFARPHWYYLKVGAMLPETFIQQFIQRVQELSNDA